MKLGFTGTREDITCEQHKTLCEWIKSHAHEITEFHHGCCIGADSEAAVVVQSWAKAAIHAHPSTLRSLTGNVALQFADVVHDRKPPLERNQDIVDACDMLIATPKTDHEELKSGTWATVRRARKAGKPVVIIRPDGAVDPPRGEPGA